MNDRLWLKMQAQKDAQLLKPFHTWVSRLFIITLRVRSVEVVRSENWPSTDFHCPGAPNGQSGGESR